MRYSALGFVLVVVGMAGMLGIAPLLTGAEQAAGGGLSGSERVPWYERFDASFTQVQDSAELRQETELVLRIKVTQISDPAWNSIDGRDWLGSDSAVALVTSTVTGEVLETWRGVVPGQRIRFTVLGDAAWKLLADEPLTYASSSGGFDVGAEHVVLLRKGILPHESGPREGWMLAHGYQGNWEVFGRQAMGRDPRFSMSMDRLQKHLQSER